MCSRQKQLFCIRIHKKFKKRCAMKENQRIAISKRMLQESLLRLLQTKELSEIRITELCREAGINRTTFYKYYSTPQDVLADIVMGLIREMKMLYPPVQTLEEVKGCLVRICKYIYERADLIRLFIRSNVDVEIANAISEINHYFGEDRESFGALKDADDDSLEMTAAFIGGGSYFLIRKWLLEDIRKTPEEVAELIFRILNMEM